MGAVDILFILSVLFVMYFFMLRPKIKEQKDAQSMLAALKKGDKVITTSGMYGEIFALKDQAVTLKFSETVKIDFAKSSIQRIVNEKTEKAEKA